MYITKYTKKADLPKGKFILHCDNYASDKKYYLIDGILSEFTVFNSAYDMAYNKRKLSSLQGLYKPIEIMAQHYKLYNITL